MIDDPGLISNQNLSLSFHLAIDNRTIIVRLAPSIAPRIYNLQIMTDFTANPNTSSPVTGVDILGNPFNGGETPTPPSTFINPINSGPRRDMYFYLEPVTFQVLISLSSTT